MKDITILFDMDGVIVDTTGGFTERWKEMFPQIPCISYEDINTFDLEELYPHEYKCLVSQVWNSQGLFYRLKPLPGAIKSIEEIKRKVRDIAICTSPPSKNKYAVQEKYEWVRDNLGSNWLKRLIITKDKTRINGDILIDDKPTLFGVQNPSWEHILYTHPWNAKITNLRRLTWKNWKEVLIELD